MAAPRSAPEPTSATTSNEPVSKSAPRASDPPSFRPAREGRVSRWLLVAAAVVGVLVLGGRYLMRADRVEAEPPRAAAPPAAVTLPNATVATPPAAAPSAEAAPSPAPSAEAAPSPAPSAEAAPDPTPADSTSPSAAPADSATPSDSAAVGSAAPVASADLINTKRTVVVTISPSNARLFRHGKPVGSSPVTIELEPGEKRRLYEVGGRGWVTRKLSVDGSKPEIFIGLKPDPTTALPANKKPL